MRRKIMLLIYIIILCSFAGCTQNSTDTKPVNVAAPDTVPDAEKNTQNAENKPSEPSEDDASKNQSNDGGNSTKPAKDNGSGKETKGNDTVVIKTESQASDKEAEEVLNQLDKELDKVIDALDSLNDVDEEDINF